MSPNDNKCKQCEWNKLTPEPGHTCSTQPEAEGADWRRNLNERFIIKRSINDRWIFCLNDDEEEDEYLYLDDHIDSLLKAQAKQIREEERERAAGIVNDSLNLVRLPWGKMEPTDFSPRACFWVNTSRSETQTKILNPTKNDPK